MKWNEISKMPVDTHNVHESCFQSYHLLEKVRDWFKRGVPPDLILEMVDEVRSCDRPVKPLEIEPSNKEWWIKDPLFPCVRCRQCDFGSFDLARIHETLCPKCGFENGREEKP